MPQGAETFNTHSVQAANGQIPASSPDANLQILARSLAHDFNNLITGILGHASFIEAIAPPEETDIVESAVIIRKTAERAAELSAQLMNLSRAGAVRAMPVDLHDTIREVAGLVSPSLGNRVRLLLDLQADPFHITGDPGQIHQALLNLAVNARDAMPGGGSLTFATESDSGGMVAIRVIDTGSGIPVEMQRRIFEPLFTTKAAGAGTGLGLAVVKRVVEEHAGVIDLRSVPGLGTTFRLCFPLREHAEGATAGLKALSVAAGS